MYTLAQIKDIDELARLRVLQQKDDWEEEYIRQDADFEKETAHFLRAHLNKDLFVFIKTVSGKIAATCCLQMRVCMPQCVWTGKEGYICNVYTLPEFRKKGFQKELLDQTIVYAKESGIEKLSLGCDNPHARAHYEKYGFKPDPLIMIKYL
ncbi:MAG: GNAT family N-acetyltransferase [Lactobacillales bacterium]|nr:GNAT family N-acetyltransferase [Lactobacillales bacterium]